MSRTKKDILDTEHMLSHLTAALWKASTGLTHSVPLSGPVRDDAESLRRISMTLHRWHELECGADHGCVEREGPNGDGKPFFTYDRGEGNGRRGRYAIPDREAGAKKRLAQILKRYPTLTAYIQTDPRGCALYILRPGDVPDGADVSSCYSRGLAVYR